MGLLHVTGTLDPNQFWPSGSSDGDTAHVHVERVTFNGKGTRAFHGAHVRGRLQKAVIDQHSRITDRLQGIDAPELHCMPLVAKAKAKQPTAEFRQYYGRLAAERLGAFLKTLGTGPLACRVVTQVEKPNDVFDTYGRFVGDIIVRGKRGKETDLNLWMARQGWAFPAFYTSMSEEEIRRFKAAAASAERKRRGIWAGYAAKLSFDGALRYSGAQGRADRGAVNFPKVFRRLALDWLSQGNTKLHAFLDDGSKGDRCYLTKEFLGQGITVARQHDMAELVSDSAVRFRPGDLVFKEADSVLLDGRERRVVGW